MTFNSNVNIYIYVRVSGEKPSHGEILPILDFDLLKAYLKYSLFKYVFNIFITCS